MSAAVSGCATSTDHSVPAQSPTPSASTSTSTGGSQDVHFTVGYAGDVLMHMPVMESTPGA